MTRDWPGRVIVYAPGAFRGGARTLLLELCRGLRSGRDVLVHDARLPDPPDGPVCEPVTNRPFARLSAELRLRRMTRPDDLVICFSSLPPLLAQAAPTVIYFQNVEILASARMRFRVLRWLLRLCHRRAYRVLCQTSPVVERLRAIGIQAARRPFLAEGLVVPVSVPLPDAPLEQLSFFYPGQPHPHKNHARLLTAWAAARDRAPMPIRLHLTLDPDAPILSGIDLDAAGIVPIGWLTSNQIAEVYRAADALVYPSYSETVGLPLLEAHAAGLPVLASDLPFAREFVQPWTVFDPMDPDAIAEAIVRFCTARLAPSRPPVPAPERLRLPDGPAFLADLTAEMARTR